jgi:hypothetical protein
MGRLADAIEDAQQRVMAAYREWPRMGFEEFMELIRIPEHVHEQGPGVKRFMSRQPAWMAGNELPWDELFQKLKGSRPRHKGLGVFGGCVYSQAPLAAARAIEEEERQQAAATGVVKPVPGIHVRRLCSLFQPRPSFQDFIATMTMLSC